MCGGGGGGGVGWTHLDLWGRTRLGGHRDGAGDHAHVPGQEHCLAVEAAGKMATVQQRHHLQQQAIEGGKRKQKDKTKSQKVSARHSR